MNKPSPSAIAIALPGFFAPEYVLAEADRPVMERPGLKEVKAKQNSTGVASTSTSTKRGCNVQYQ